MRASLNGEIRPISTLNRWLTDSDGAPLPSIDEMRALYVRDSLLTPRGSNVDIIIDGTRVERRAAASPVQIIAYAGDWTGEPVSLLRRVWNFLFGVEALGDHAPTSAP